MEPQLCRWMLSVCAVCLLLLCGQICCALATEPTSLRGVAPSKLHLYQNRFKFTCLSDRTEIDITRANDDVCDCADGSDEPGTSACANGSFYCRNQGFKSRELPSTFVDDGVCDCCDGTDEAQGCHNSCEGLGQLARSDAQIKLNRHLAGAKAKSALVTEAARKLQAWKERSVELQNIVGQLKPVVVQLHDDMQEAQTQQREAEEAAKASREDDQAHVAEPAEEAQEILETDYAVVDDHEDEDMQAESDEAADAEEEAKRIAAQWTSDPAAAGNAVPAEDTATAHDNVEIDAQPEEIAFEPSQPKTVLQQLADTVRSLGKGVWSPRRDAGKSAQEQLIQLTRASKQAVQKHNAKQHELRTAETELRTLRINLGRDYGPENVYAALHDLCLEMPQDKYRYRFCGFDKAAQLEGASEVSLGKFERCEDGCSRMFYTQGQACWQGPARSMQVQLQCGPRNEIVSVEEPERCVYVAVANSPAQCSDRLLQDLRDELSKFEVALETDVKDEL